MSVYMISYDLNKSGKNYDGVIEAIKSASTGAWCKPLESVFLIQSYLSVDEVSDKIKGEADTDDRWIVIEVKNNKQGWLDKDMWDYINSTVFQ